MRRASPLALAVLLALAASPLAALPASASPAPRFATLPGDTARAKTKLTADGRYIVTLKDGTDVDAAKGRAARLGVKPDRTYKHALKGYSAHLDPGQLAALRTDPDVDAVVPDEVFSMTAQTRPTGIKRVNVPENQIAQINGTDGDVTSGERVDADVAIVDTGIDKNHPDLNVVGGISCSTDNPNAWGDDPNGHGTHVAGTVGALDNTIGVVGVAPGVRLWAVRILNSAGDGLLSWYVCGLDWITAQKDPLDPTRPLIEAVNMSVAKDGTDDNNCGFTNKDVIHKAICRLVATGVTVVAAAGNNHFSAAKLKPASYNEVITVSALADTDGRPGGEGGNLCYSWGGYDQDDTFADFSNFGVDVDLIAPGKCIYSTLPGNHYGYISGTSMAAPHVTGAAALYKASRPLATPAEVRARAAGRGQPRLEDVHRPGLGPRAAAGRVAHRRARRLRPRCHAVHLALVARRGGGRDVHRPGRADPRGGLPGRGGPVGRRRRAVRGRAGRHDAHRPGPGVGQPHVHRPAEHARRHLPGDAAGHGRDPRADVRVPDPRRQRRPDHRQSRAAPAQRDPALEP